MNRQDALRRRDPSRYVLVALAGAIVECPDPAPARQAIFVRSANALGDALGGDAIERHLKERFGSIEAVPFPEVHSVEAVAQEDVQDFAGKTPVPGAGRQRLP